MVQKCLKAHERGARQRLSALIGFLDELSTRGQPWFGADVSDGNSWLRSGWRRRITRSPRPTP
jgi:hypothetical protein